MKGHKSRPQAKDITDEALLAHLADSANERTFESMARSFGSHPKVIERVMERLDDRGLIQWGVSLRTAWLTDDGKALLGDRASA